MAGTSPKARSQGASPQTMSGYDISNYGEAEAASKIRKALDQERAADKDLGISYRDKPYVSGTFGETPKTDTKEGTTPSYSKGGIIKRQKHKYSKY